MTSDRMDDIQPVRTFRSGTELAVGLNASNGSYFVMMRGRGESAFSTHCGPYSTREQGEEWIQAIREDRR